jgi:hypothetical protein
MLGGEHTAKSVRCLREFGRVIVYGSATGEKGTLDPRILYARGTSVHGLWLTQLANNRAVMGAGWKQLSEWIERDLLRPVIGEVFPLEQIDDAAILTQRAFDHELGFLRQRLTQIVEHGLRHLAWLVREDDAIHEALPAWAAALAAYAPEPFRAFTHDPLA